MNPKPVRYAKPVSLREIPLIERAYLAGLFDGEGHLGEYPQNRGGMYWRVVITNTSESLMAYLKTVAPEITPILVRRKLSSGRGNDQVCWDWRLWRIRDIHMFLTHIEPYLKIKREKVQVAIANLEERLA